MLGREHYIYTRCAVIAIHRKRSTRSASHAFEVSMSLSKIRKFQRIWREEGLRSSLTVSWRYIYNRTVDRFRWSYWRRNPVYLHFVYANVWLRQRLNRDSVTDADPFKLVWVRPEAIQRMTGGYSDEWGVVTDDGWETKPIEEHDRYSAIKQHFGDGETHEDISEGKEKLYRSMKEDGYRSQRELRHPVQWLPFHYRDFEIAVDIDANGDLYWSGWGRNRLFIAKVLGLDEIAVQVRRRHTEWQKIRDEVRSADAPSKLSDRAKGQLDHPDLEDVVPDEWNF